MKKTTLAGVLALAVLGTFFATHHAVYGNCHQTTDGKVCTLLGYKGNK